MNPSRRLIGDFDGGFENALGDDVAGSVGCWVRTQVKSGGARVNNSQELPEIPVVRMTAFTLLLDLLLQGW